MRGLYCVPLLALAVVAGCGGAPTGPKLYPASGTVLVKGQPVAGATVSMMSEGGKLSTGSTDAQGKYKMSTGGQMGMPVGKVKVGITKPVVDSPAPTSMKPEDMMNRQKAETTRDRNWVPKSEISEKYADPQKSPLAAEVTTDSSKNVFDFKLDD